MAADAFDRTKPVPQLPSKGGIDKDKPFPSLPPPLWGYATNKEPGVYGGSAFDARPGVSGIHGDGGFGVFGQSAKGVGVYGKGPYLAGYFDGDVTVRGTFAVEGNIDVFGTGCDIRLSNADCAEDFDVIGSQKVDPGTVMVLGEEGALRESDQAYDKRVAGVISGAGDYKPAIVLDGRKKSGNRQPIALIGKVFCKVDAGFGGIEVGDLLTTSSTPGHAMRASESTRAFGSIIGKALRALPSGKELIPILVVLQ